MLSLECFTCLLNLIDIISCVWCGQWSVYYLITELSCIFCTFTFKCRRIGKERQSDGPGQVETGRNGQRIIIISTKWKQLLYFQWMQPKHNNFSEFIRFRRWKLMMIKPKNTIKSEQQINLNNWQLHYLSVYIWLFLLFVFQFVYNMFCGRSISFYIINNGFCSFKPHD